MMHVQESNLQDSAGGRPSYNLRTLTRALQYARRAWPIYGLQRALFHGLAMAFLTQLHPSSAPRLEGILQGLILGSNKPKHIKVLFRALASRSERGHCGGVVWQEAARPPASHRRSWPARALA